VARANARALVDDFLSLAGRPSQIPAWEPEVAARRMLAFLSQSPVILDGADRPFYRRFMKGLGRTQLFLERKIAGGSPANRASLPRSRSPNSAYARKAPAI